MDMMGNVLNRRYEITAELGAGAMGIVYHARDLQSGGEVAIKVLPPALSRDPQYLARFEREANTLRELNHPNIVHFVDHFQETNNYYIVMEYMPGGSLYDLLRKEGALHVDEARQIAIDISDALIRAHRLDIVHRDLKPENILFDASGVPRLADFGVAGITAPGENTRLTGTGTQMGTPNYMSPEAWQGERLDVQSDIWGLGVVLYEMLAGQAPFRGETAIAVMREVLQKPTPDIRQVRHDIPDGIYEIIGKALAKDKTRRYQSMREIGTDLERGAPATPLRRSTIRARGSWLPGMMVAGVMIVTVIAAVVIGLLVMGDDGENEVAAPPIPTESPVADASATPMPSATDNETTSQALISSNLTQTAALWTETPDLTLTTNALLTQTQNTIHMEQTTVAESHTNTPTATTSPTAMPDPTATPDTASDGTQVALAYESIGANADWTPIVQEFDGVEMVLVPVGCFEMGSTEGDRDEVPPHEQCFDQPFWIDRYEVSNEQFASLPEAEACSEASSEPDQPRNCVTWFEAAAHCEERGTRLPTEAEWEYAARGPDGLVFPWGKEFDPDDAVYGANSRRHTASVGSRPSGASWVGSLDMIGNVWEWVNTIYDQDQFPYPFDPDDGRSDSRDHDSSRVLRGGSFPDITNIRAANRNYNYPDEAGIGDGFRCARDFDASR